MLICYHTAAIDPRCWQYSSTMLVATTMLLRLAPAVCTTYSLGQSEQCGS